MVGARKRKLVNLESKLFYKTGSQVMAMKSGAFAEGCS